MASAWKPDEIVHHSNGSRTEIRWRKRTHPRGDRARIRKEKDQHGKTIEVWHEVFDKNGRLIHQSQKPVYDA